MTIGIIANDSRDSGFVYTKEIAAFLISQGIEPVFEKPVPGYEQYKNTPYSCPYLIVLGGDGTMLRASHTAAMHNTPMLGINLGKLGYLTDSDRQDGIAAIKKLLEGKYHKEKRLMLEVGKNLALNDIFIRYTHAAKLMTYHIYVNNKLTDSLRADGMIVSTPTGSTAYSLSAGGPILKPDSEMLLLTPVCPHTLYARPWVLSGRDEIKIQTEAVDGEEAAVYMDGEFAFHIGSGTFVNIRKSDFKATIIKTSDMDFFEVLRKKMGSVQ